MQKACRYFTSWYMYIYRYVFQDLLPNVFTYSAAISACEKGEQWRQALGVLVWMQEADVMPSVITYNGAISACE
jgi:hypothetical protein